MNESVTLQKIVDNVNNLNFNKEIVVFESDQPLVYSQFFPLRLEAMLIILWKKGYGKIGIDLQEYELRSNTLIVIQPQNYIQFNYAGPDSQAAVVVISKKVLETVIPHLTDILPLILHHRAKPVNYLSEDEANGMYAFYNFLHSNLQAPPTPFIKQKLYLILQAALFEMTDIFLMKQNHSEQKCTRKEEIMAKFIISLGENFRKKRTVIFYANELCISPKHLTTVVRDISGRTAGEWIQSYVIMEAKILLRSSDKNIQEIASYLNFPDQSFFGKYFKHATGFSPSEYRKLDR